MSDAHSIPVSHPFFDDNAVDGGNYLDGINNCATILWALTDLFDYREESTALDSPRTRRGMFSCNCEGWRARWTASANF